MYYIMNILKELYYNPTYGLLSENNLYKKAKDKDKNITHALVKEFLNKQEAHQLSKKYIKPKQYIPIIAKYPHEIIQIDLLDLSNLSTTNSYYNFILIAVDVFTRYAYFKPLKNKSSDSVLTAIKDIVNQSKPLKIQCDQGSEFINKHFKDFMKENNIEVQYIYEYEKNKLGIINRLCRTIRSLINKYLSAYHTSKYIDVIDKLFQNYNNSYHSTIKMIPSEAFKHINDIQQLNTIRYNESINYETTFNIGDRVRYIINLKQFDKKSLPHWSKTVHIIVKRTEHSYKLDNDKYYMYYQLQKVNDVYDAGVNTRTRQKQNIPQPEELKKARTIKRRLNKEDIDLSNVIQGKRERKQVDRYHN